MGIIEELVEIWPNEVCDTYIEAQSGSWADQMEVEEGIGVNMQAKTSKNLLIGYLDTLSHNPLPMDQILDSSLTN